MLPPTHPHYHVTSSQAHRGEARTDKHRPGTKISKLTRDRQRHRPIGRCRQAGRHRQSNGQAACDPHTCPLPTRCQSPHRVPGKEVRAPALAPPHGLQVIQVVDASREGHLAPMNVKFLGQGEREPGGQRGGPSQAAARPPFAPSRRAPRKSGSGAGWRPAGTAPARRRL